MAYKTFAEQAAEHIAFLRGNGLEVSELAIDAGFIRCRGIGDPANSRGEYSYKTDKSKLDKPGLIGLATWCRGPGGGQLKHNTYGQDGECGSSTTEKLEKPAPSKAIQNDEVVKKALYLWKQANETGRADYLERKGVGAYGIRFSENAYGRTALVPARDPDGRLLAVQFLNSDGSKRFLKGSSWSGLFHMLQAPKNGEIIGIAESYATAASCLELSGVPTVCAFNAGNLKAVTNSLLKMFPDSRLIIFADNDRHLEARGLPNEGVLKARQACEAFKGKITLAAPDFGGCEPSKDFSDWNDLVRLKGKENARAHLIQFL